jgi:UDP-glucuronate decarboxylase
MADLAQRLLTLTGSASQLIRAPLPADAPRQRCSDITLARSLFGWQPRIPLETGLQRTIDWFRTRLAQG